MERTRPLEAGRNVQFHREYMQVLKRNSCRANFKDLERGKTTNEQRFLETNYGIHRRFPYEVHSVIKLWS